MIKQKIIEILREHKSMSRIYLLIKTCQNFNVSWEQAKQQLEELIADKIIKVNSFEIETSLSLNNTVLVEENQNEL